MWAPQKKTKKTSPYTETRQIKRVVPRDMYPSIRGRREAKFLSRNVFTKERFIEEDSRKRGMFHFINNLFSGWNPTRAKIAR